MSAPVPSPEARANARQREAADPRASAWVAASAGAGKTKVLTDRVLRLLLADAKPGKILCLTFTNAAAAEMSNRLADSLGRWATIPDKTLHAEISRLLGGPFDADLPTRARKLFAAVLEAPGGVHIQTLHAFCQSLLKRFPVEARVPPHFTVMDERDASEALEAARREVLTGRGGDAAFAQSLVAVTRRVDEEGFDKLVVELNRNRGRLRRLVASHGGVEGVIDELVKRLGLNPGMTPETVLAAASADGAIDAPALRAAAAAMLEGGKTDKKHGQLIADWLAAPKDRAATFWQYGQAFFTDKGSRRARLIGKDALAAAPDADEALLAEAARLEDAIARYKAANVAECTAALLRVGDAMLEAYTRHKEARARLDYDDLILHARNLLTTPGVAPWVLYKLDGGIDHILIDEAQDTSPEQWEVVKALAEEFFAGESAREQARTLFAVGDIKQSIFSIQRADPDAFARMRDHFAARAEAVGQSWRPVELDISFRSTEAVLAAVDTVFRDEAARDGLVFGEHGVGHTANRAGEAGLVELWPLAEKPDRENDGGWALPEVAEHEPAPAKRLARHIARTIGGWLDSGERLEANGRRVRAGDIMVLVRTRNIFVEELVRALKDEGVPVAGIDRMVLTEQIAVMDLIALGNFLLLPGDDLTLATVLKGPLVGLDEDQLFDLAYDRGGDSLWRRLSRRAGADDSLGRAHEFLAGLLARADFVPPYELYADVLGAGGRRALVGRLGPDADDPIDEFLALALSHERAHVPSLQGFLHWVESGKAEIKRDLEQGERDEVRVMTVHGAKGLEAPIVFLPDTTGLPPARSSGLLWPGDESAAPLWVPRKDDADPVSAQARDEAARRAMREYRRLLYVAMTRAEDRLYICGWQARKSVPGECWYTLAAAAMGDIGAPFDFDAGEGWSGQGRRLATGKAKTAPGESEADAGAIAASLPDWAREAAPDEPAPPIPLAPSRPAEEEPAVRSPLGQDEGARFQRGLLIHRLLQTLPELPPAERADVCRRFLARRSHGLDDAAQAEIAAETLAVLEAPEFGPLFGPGSLAETPIAGIVGDQAIAGQVDRLLITDDSVTIVDFKSNRPPPKSPAEVAPLYLRQMAAYRAVLREIYPDLPVKCALLWTDGPTLMPLDDAALDRHAP